MAIDRHIHLRLLFLLTLATLFVAIRSIVFPTLQCPTYFSSCYQNHPVLKPFLVVGANSRDPTQLPQDHMGHSTQVASVIAAVWGRVGGKRVP